MQKRCPTCSKSKKIEEFNSQRTYCLVCHREKGRKWRLDNPEKQREAQRKNRAAVERTREWKDRQNEYTRQHYSRNKAEYVARSAVAKKKNRRRFVEYKKTLKCERCPEADHRCLHFHHLRDKEFAIADMARKGFSLKNIMKEIEKCIVLCANCHAKEHYAD